MIHRDNRTGFRQPVSLYDNKAAALPEFLKARIHAGASDDEGPKLPTESPVQFSMTPHSPQHTRWFFCFGTSMSSRLVLQVFEDLRNAYQNRNSILVNEVDDLAGMDFCCERSRTFKKERHEDPERLTEHVTERKQIENSNRLKRACPQFVFRDLFLKRPQV